jgi:RNA polymerase sigma factor (sigma-70 family)
MMAAGRGPGRPKKSEQVEYDPFWYVPNPWLRTKSALTLTKQVLDYIRGPREELDQPKESDLFRSLHVCAFHASDTRRRRKPLSASQKAKWAQRWHEVREYIVEANLGLVYSTLERFFARNTDEDDLQSEALFALSKAVERFNPWIGFKFSTYAVNCIVRACARRGRRETKRKDLFPVSFDGSFERPSEPEDFNEKLRMERLRIALNRNVGELTELESQILSQRFPRDSEEQRTFKEIARTVGLSKERVRQIQNAAIEKLREKLIEDPILE